MLNSLYHRDYETLKRNVWNVLKTCFLVFIPEFKYKEITRARRDVSGSGESLVPVEVRFTALGRQFHFELEAASKPFTDMSHVLIRRWVIVINMFDSVPYTRETGNLALSGCSDG